MKLTPSQQHTMIDRPHLAHLFALALRLGVRESIDRPALAWMELEREAGRMGEETVDSDAKLVYNEGVSTDYARAANSRAALTEQTEVTA